MPGIGADGAVNWRVVTNGTFYAAGPFTFDPATGTFFADVPVRRWRQRASLSGVEHRLLLGVR